MPRWPGCRDASSCRSTCSRPSCRATGSISSPPCRRRSPGRSFARSATRPRAPRAISSSGFPIRPRASSTSMRRLASPSPAFRMPRSPRAGRAPPSQAVRPTRSRATLTGPAAPSTKTSACCTRPPRLQTYGLPSTASAATTAGTRPDCYGRCAASSTEWRAASGCAGGAATRTPSGSARPSTSGGSRSGSHRASCGFGPR